MAASHKPQRRLGGMIVPMVTPLSEPEELDVRGVDRLVARLLDGGVHGVFLLGSCGEGPSHSYRLRRKLITQACRLVDGRIPVLVGVTDSTPAESTALAQHAADAGAAAIVIAPPYYFPLTQPELLAYVNRQVDASPLPVVLYNMPDLTKVAFEPETVRRLMDRPRVIGLKDSSGDLDYVRRVRSITQARADWSLLIGPEHLLGPAMEFGADGGVSGGANVWPQLLVQIYEAASAGTLSHERPELLAKLAQLNQIYSVGGDSASAVVKGLKAALATLGVCSGLPAPPLAPLAPDEIAQINNLLESLGVDG
jgi:4-hydroxy-tetrahydrodipicolinate synthase